MKNVVGWILAVFLALLFALVGGLKLIGVPAMVKEFWADRTRTVVSVLHRHPGSHRSGRAADPEVPVLGGIADRDHHVLRHTDQPLGAPCARARARYRSPHGPGACSWLVAPAAKGEDLGAGAARCVEAIHRYSRGGSGIVLRPRGGSDGLPGAQWFRQIDHHENDHGVAGDDFGRNPVRRGSDSARPDRVEAAYGVCAGGAASARTSERTRIPGDGGSVAGIARQSDGRENPRAAAFVFLAW